jgi:uncharacterized protein
MEAIIDTNVLVSGLLRADGKPGEIINLIFKGRIIPVFDDRIIFEYRDVLFRHKFSFNRFIVEDLLSSIQTIGRHVIAQHASIKLPDKTDQCFFECALSSESRILITGNRKHFPLNLCRGIIICSPGDFLDSLEA